MFDEMVRFEYSPDKQFEDHASLAVINRLLPVPKYTVSYANGWLIISTSALEVHYKNSSILPFIPDNIYIKFWMNGKEVQWSPTQSDTGNLYGLRAGSGTGGAGWVAVAERAVFSSGWF